jgi:hypothetical protein
MIEAAEAAKRKAETSKQTASDQPRSKGRFQAKSRIGLTRGYHGGGRASERLAKSAGVSHATIERAKKVKSITPDLLEK